MFVADLVLVLLMVGTSAVAALALPPNGMLPVNLGAGLSWMPKSIGLAVWPGIGVVSYLGTRLSAAFGRLSVQSQVGLTIALALMLSVQTGSILIALNRRGRP
jgi:hypothetical protein